MVSLRVVRTRVLWRRAVRPRVGVLEDVLNEASSLDDLAEAEKLFSDNLRKSTRLHGSNHPTTAQLAHQLKSAHKLISAIRLRDRARREEAAGGKQTFHERAFAPGWLDGSN